MLTLMFSCNNETTLNFEEISIIDANETTIEVTIPKAEGNTKAANQINNTLIHFVTSALNFDTTSEPKNTISEAITDFKKAYNNFKTQIGKTLFTNLPPWEVLIDGELLYKNKTIASIAMSSSINTGGARSNLEFKFFNFNLETGQELQTTHLINDIPAFTTLAQKYYNKELLSATNERIDAFSKQTFKLPEHLGFSEDGVIFFYETFNSATNNIIEFTIPYTVANSYLNF